MLQAIGIFDLGLCTNGLCVISPNDLSLLLLMAANPLLAIFGLYDLPTCLGDTGDVYLYADYTTLSVTGEIIDEVFAALSTMVEMVLQWSINNQLTIHPIKTEAMLIRKSPFIGPLPHLRFGYGFVRFVESSTCLGEKLDNRLSWSDHLSHVRKCFALKGWCTETNELPSRETLQEIYFKTTIPSVTYCILILGNFSTTLLSHLASVHSRAARVIFNFDLFLSDAECLLLKSNWPSISYF